MYPWIASGILKEVSREGKGAVSSNTTTDRTVAAAPVPCPEHWPDVSHVAELRCWPGDPLRPEVLPPSLSLTLALLSTFSM